MRKGPYLLYTGDNTGMTILWQTDRSPEDCLCGIEWGSAKGQYEHGPEKVWENDSYKEHHQFKFHISGRSPGSVTYYRITCEGKSVQTFTGSFRTAPRDDATSLTFYAYGDTRGTKRNPSRQNYVLEQLMKDMDKDPANRQTLCIHSGDFAKWGMVETCWDERDEDRRDNGYFIRKEPNMRFLASIPVMGCLGNHEGYGHGYIFDYDAYGKLFKKYWPYPFYPSGKMTSFYYSFNYGPVHFSVVDVNDRNGNYEKPGDKKEEGRNLTLAGLRPGTDQYKWLNGDISGSSKPWKIVVFHNPAWAASKGRERYQHIRDNLHPLFIEKGIKLVIQGHNHFYSRCVKDGITYLTLGGGGAGLYDPDAKGPTKEYPFVIKAKKAYHFARFKVSANQIEVTVIDSSGNNVETFYINK